MSNPLCLLQKIQVFRTVAQSRNNNNEGQKQNHVKGLTANENGGPVVIDVDRNKSVFSFWDSWMTNRNSAEIKDTTTGELQTMLPKASYRFMRGKKTSSKMHPDKPAEICLLRHSPFRILRAAESGNIEEFNRLYQADPKRLEIRDGRGRAAVHQAASRNRVNILEFIYSHGGDLDIQDNSGNTALHIAVESTSLDAIDFLLKNGARSGILNEKKQAPVHLATELNRVTVLSAMIKYRDRIDVQQGGEHGRTPLHIAAMYDHDECARILITDFGANPRKACNNGYYPIHNAAKNASSRTMEVFLQWGESRGCSREEMISLHDAEGNAPLHSAVHGGDIKAVELCLKSGAKISTQQQDLSTPVHLACAQGAIEIVKLMFALQPSEKYTCLSSCDIQKMMPLHCAAMFDHPEIVEYLILEGADMNALDKERRSPLLLAAARSGWRTVHCLIRLGANIHLKDVNRRNVLHLVVMNGGRLEEFAAEVNKCKVSLLLLLNEKDETGCSPLHYASREGHIRSLENLIKLGACINLKNNNNESPLHFAARYGRYNTVRQLLDSEKGTFIINESNGEGLTPLHISSQQGHTRVVQLLLNRGALLHRDHNGRNPLHLAAMSGYTQTIELLYSVHSQLLDQTDKDGNTALHLATMENKPSAIGLLLSMNCQLLYNDMDMSAIDYAIYYKFPEAALVMVTHEERAQEIMSLKSDKHPCVTLALIASMPRVFEAVQDKCITKANCKKDSKSFYIKYSFSSLQCSQTDEETGEISTAVTPGPLPALNAMVVHGRVELLAHPLSQKYLQMKWNSYGKYFHIANLLFYTIFLAFVTIFSSQLMNLSNNAGHKIVNVNYTKKIWNNGTALRNLHRHVLSEDGRSHRATPMMFMSAVIIMIYVALYTLREILQLYQQRWKYLFDPVNSVSWHLYICSSIMVVPIFFDRLDEIQFSCASITVFLSWFNLLLLLQRFDQVGIYVVMFLEILQTLIKVLLVFSILIIAFGLAFYILLSRGNHISFSTIPMSLMRTFAMMLGEIDFLGTYVEPYYHHDSTCREENPKGLPFPFPSFLILGVFMVLMPILLMNLLIGLAVGDIESVRRNAQLKRLAMQVVLHTELERKLPRMLLAKVDKMELKVYPNEMKSKLGFLDFILKKWICNPFTDDDGAREGAIGNASGGVISIRNHGSDMVLESNDDYITEELDKQKRRLKDISSALETQHQLLRLIVQKMEIKTEADDVDEGVSLDELRLISGNGSKWSSPKMKKTLRSSINFSKGSSF
ncbi:transient receptor potential cation channel subfamily A member 1 isoform X2 [Cephus cinctus]|uniref:Transient receptor potential cation channel subfamily A member 1 isoform X2 n=1 Tax=Cephus cinctus TaxID=211228 RepID=A0AAJ7C386_CEPCN|nr:transient receptor potential cation channel subfamily A member 1 isoform X2 [Cephus cinctus]